MFPLGPNNVPCLSYFSFQRKNINDEIDKNEIAKTGLKTLRLVFMGVVKDKPKTPKKINPPSQPVLQWLIVVNCSNFYLPVADVPTLRGPVWLKKRKILNFCF